MSAGDAAASCSGVPSCGRLRQCHNHLTGASPNRPTLLTHRPPVDAAAAAATAAKVPKPGAAATGAAAALPVPRFDAMVFAGQFGVAGTSGDGGQAVDALVNNPFGVIRGPDRAIYFCEYDGECVRRVGLDGIISTIAGCGRTGGAGDGGTALDAEFNKPHEIRFGETAMLL